MTRGLVKLVLVVLVQLNFCLPAYGDNLYYDQQRNALMNISYNWKPKNNHRPNDYLPGWGSTDTQSGQPTVPCFASTAGKNWQGVECLQQAEDLAYVGSITNASDYIITVVGLTLQEASISGTLPAAIGDLVPLLFLTLTGNQELTGLIPQDLASLSDSLITLNLHNNGFYGPIPTAISDLRNLITLDLGNNSLTGEFPLLYYFPSLQTLDLSSNKLDGEIPIHAFDKLTNLITMDLSNNNFSGPLPTLTSRTIFKGLQNLTYGLPMIKHMNLSRNAFNESLSDLGKVTFNQSFYGPSYSTSSFLQVLDLSHNNIWGDVSNLDNVIQAIGSQILAVYLDNNNISGTLFLDNYGFLNSNSQSFSRPQILSLVNNSIERVEGFDPTNNIFSNIRLDGNPFCNSKADNNSLQGFAASCFCRQDCQNYAYIKKVKSAAVKIALAISVPSVVLVVLVAALLYHKSTRQVRQQHKYNLIQMQKRFEEFDVKPTIFTYRELETATQNFHPSMKLGEGSYGAVYKGELCKSNIVGVDELSKSNIVAVKTVKQLHINSEQGMDEFLNEVALISGMKHRNLVRLKGCCLRDKQRLLVYEYVDNHDVEWHLFEGKSEENLSWPHRLKICVGVAHGLHYLHSLAQPKIIHRDIKAANILLDNNFDPKIADFGLALLFPEETSHIMTVHVAGTKGYLAPEYASLGQLSEKADVYSFGVVCLELVSGRRNVDNKMEPDQVVLANWALKLHREGRTIDVLDPMLNSLSESELLEVNRVILTALLCLQHDEVRRPLMANVVAMLHGDLHTDVDIETADIPPGFDEYSTSFEIQQPGLGTIMEDRSVRLFDGQSSTEASLYQLQR